MYSMVVQSINGDGILYTPLSLPLPLSNHDPDDPDRPAI